MERTLFEMKVFIPKYETVLNAVKLLDQALVSFPGNQETKAIRRSLVNSGTNVTPEQIIREFVLMSDGARAALNLNGSPRAYIGWYDWQEDLRKFSKIYPLIKFRLIGTTSFSESWCAYVVNGYMQIESIETAIPEFDTERLVPIFE